MKVNKDLTREFLSFTESEVLAANLRHVKSRVESTGSGSKLDLILSYFLLAFFALSLVGFAILGFFI